LFSDAGRRIASIFVSRLKIRPPRMPVGGALEHAGDAQQFLFLERRGKDLCGVMILMMNDVGYLRRFGEVVGVLGGAALTTQEEKARKVQDPF
jgi:hypothetical protein